MPEYEDSDTSEQPTGGLSGPQVKMGAPKSGGMSVQGKIALDSTETDQILTNMQKMIDARQAPMYQINESLKDMAAWFSGPNENRTQALATRDIQKRASQKELFDMQQQMAAYRAAQKEADDFRKEQGSSYTGLPGAQQGPGVSASQADALAAQIPGAQSQGGKIYFKGTEIDLATATAMKNARTREDRDRIFNAYALESAKSNLKWNADVGAYENKIEEAIDGRIYNLDAMTKRDIRNFAMKNNMSFKDAARIYLGITPPSGEQAKQPGTTAVQQQVAASDIPKPQTGIRHNAIRIVESGGDPNAVSEKGARGEMQVMSKTLKNPGFGVRPAQNDSPAELKRVGEDYFDALKKHYGDEAIALAAYNHGTGNIDSWLKKGGNWKDLPAQTRDYISKVYLENAKQAMAESKGKLTTAPAETSINTQVATTAAPQAPQAPQGTMMAQQNVRQPEPTLAEIKTEMASKEKGLSEEFTGSGKNWAKRQETVVADAGEADTFIANAKFLNNLATTHPQVFGVLQDPGLNSAILGLVEKGLTTPNGTIGIGGIDMAVLKSIPGVTRENIAAVKMAASKFAELQLKAAKIMRGDGQITEGERAILRDWVGSEKDSPEAIKAFLAWGTARANFDKKLGALYDSWRDNNTGASFERFPRTKEVMALKEQYNKEMQKLAVDLVPQNTSKLGKSTPTQGKTPSGVTWSFVKKPGSKE